MGQKVSLPLPLTRPDDSLCTARLLSKDEHVWDLRQHR